MSEPTNNQWEVQSETPVPATSQSNQWEVASESPISNTPTFVSRAYDTSGVKSLVDMASEKAQQLSVHNLMSNDITKAVKEGRYRDAALGLGQLIYKMGNPEDAIAQGIIDSHLQEIGKAHEAWKKAALTRSAADISEAGGHTLAAMLPIIGPMSSHAGELTGQDLAAGNYGAAAGDVTGAVAPVLLPEAGRLAGRAGRAAGRAVMGAEESPTVVGKIVKGESAAQPGTQSAVREAVKASTETTGTADESLAANIEQRPLLQGGKTVLDEHMNALAENEKAAYQKVDEAAGFDVKAEKAQLANDKYKLKQLGNTDADVTQRGNLIESINDSEARITEAESKMRQAGIDPKEADTLHQQRMAGNDFKKVLIKNTNPDGSVNVDGLLKASKGLRFTKFGDRLVQFMGKEGADTYMSQLQKMQELGAHSAKAQAIAKTVGTHALTAAGIAGVGAIGAAAYEAVK